jgi:hypothetical protein
VTPPIRFLFDECVIGRRTVERELTDSLALFGAAAELAHLFDKFPPGTADSVWIPQIASEGGWIVITSDRGKTSRKSEKLPLICRELGVTHVVLSAGLHKRSTHYRVLAISSCWPQLIAAADAPGGTRFTVSIHTGKRGTTSFRFRETGSSR